MHHHNGCFLMHCVAVFRRYLTRSYHGRDLYKTITRGFRRLDELMKHGHCECNTWLPLCFAVFTLTTQTVGRDNGHKECLMAVVTVACWHGQTSAQTAKASRARLVGGSHIFAAQALYFVIFSMESCFPFGEKTSFLSFQILA